jgi:7-cyano-7-deazaguanine reductase
MTKKQKQYTAQHAESGVKEQLPAIETWPNQYPGYEIEITMPEFTSVCPKTGLPDHGTVRLVYTPDKACLELKSLKMYTLAYRNLGIFQENIVNKFLEDVVRAAKPLRAVVIGDFTPRGGIATKVTAQYQKGK